MDDRWAIGEGEGEVEVGGAGRVMELVTPPLGAGWLDCLCHPC